MGRMMAMGAGLLAGAMLLPQAAARQPSDPLARPSPVMPAHPALSPDATGITPAPPIPATPAARPIRGEEPPKAEPGNGPWTPDILSDPSLLPAPVARIRQQLLEAAYSGDIERLRPILEGNEGPPIVSFGGESPEPIAFWKQASGDGEGRELLAILIEVLESDFVHVEAGTANELYVWPYFAYYPLDRLTPAQEVELYMLVTAQDKRDMDQFGAYNFYRIGFSPDGRWHYFVAGD